MDSPLLESVAEPQSRCIVDRLSVDATDGRMQFAAVSKAKKHAAPAQEKTTPGTVMVGKYRPAMNKLTDTEREKLMAHAMVTIYGQPENAGRR